MRCDPPSDTLGLTCDKTTSDNYFTFSANWDDATHVTEVDFAGGPGNAGETYVFLESALKRVLGSSRGSTVSGWISSHANADIAEQTFFTSFHVVYRGPMSMGSIQILPP
jgi:hypothetical protein